MKKHPADSLLCSEKQSQLEHLIKLRSNADNKDGSGEYGRLTAKIRYLRYGPQYVYEWRKKNSERIKYERACGIAYSSRQKGPITQEQRIARNEAVKRSDAKNPQRQIRRNTERIILFAYNAIVEGKVFTRNPARAEELWGCSLADFKAHIDGQLAAKGWLWSDWKIKWTMDHIIPVRNFLLPDQEKACWHYSNLRPLAKEKNHRGFKN